MSTFNKSEFRSITVAHAKTDAQRTFLVKFDGSVIISCAYRTAGGTFKRTRVQKMSLAGNDKTGRVYRACTFNSPDAQGKSRPDAMYTHRLVFGAWCNGGVMPPSGGELHVDHIDNDPKNNHFSNLQLLTASENLQKGSTVASKAVA